MRNLVALAVLLGVIGLPRVWSTWAGSRADWRKHVSTEGRYSVLMPTDVERDEEPVALHDGGTTMHYDHARRTFGTFAVAYCDYPEALFQESASERVLDACVEGWARDQGAEMGSIEPMTIEGHPGRELRGLCRTDEGEPAEVHARVFLDDHRLYLVHVLFHPGDSDPELVRRFYDSFRLL